MSVPVLEPGEAGGPCPRSGDMPLLLGRLGGTGHHPREGEGWLGTLHNQVSTIAGLTAAKDEAGTIKSNRRLDHTTEDLTSGTTCLIEEEETQGKKMPPDRWKT